MRVGGILDELSRRCRNSFAFRLGPVSGAGAVSSPSGKKRAVRRIAQFEPVFEMMQPAQALGGELGDAIDVARLQWAGSLIEPDGGVAQLLANSETISEWSMKQCRVQSQRPPATVEHAR